MIAAMMGSHQVRAVRNARWIENIVRGRSKEGTTYKFGAFLAWQQSSVQRLCKGRGQIVHLGDLTTTFVKETKTYDFGEDN